MHIPNQGIKNRSIKSKNFKNLENASSRQCLESDAESGGSSDLEESTVNMSTTSMFYKFYIFYWVYFISKCIVFNYIWLKNFLEYQKKSLLLLIEIGDEVNTLSKVNNNNGTPNEVNMIMDVETLEKENNALKDMDEKKILVFYMILLYINILLKFKSVEDWF